MTFFDKPHSSYKCAFCCFFLDDPVDFEKALPGLCILSSGQGDTKGDQGICTLHQRLVISTMSCKKFTRRRLST